MAAVPAEPEVAGRGRELGGEALRDAGSSAHELDAGLGELEVPRVEPGGAGPPARREEGVALREGGAVTVARNGSRGPQGCRQPVESSAARAGPSLNQLEAIGHENGERWTDIRRLRGHRLPVQEVTPVARAVY